MSKSIEPVRVMQAQGVVNSEMQEEDEVIIVKMAFRPVVRLMNIFGLCSDTITIGKGATKKRHNSLKIYGGIMILLMIGNVARLIPGLVTGKGYDLHFRITYLIWNIRCTMQAAYLIYICWPSRKAASRLVKLIQDFDLGLNAATLEGEKNSVRRFKRATNIVFIVINILTIFNSLFVLMGMFIQALDIHTILENMLYPLSATVAVKLCYFVLQFILSVIWMAPLILYIQSSQSLVFLLNMFEADVKGFGASLSLPSHITKIRCMYLKVSNLVQATDEIYGPIALTVYFFDIVQFSFVLYIAMYSAKSSMEKFLACFWALSSLVNLLIMSFAASNVEEKVGN